MSSPPPIAPPEVIEACDPLVGRVFGRFELVRVVGRGGMGTVYEALHRGIGKRVALKVVSPELARAGDQVARFQREAQAASAIESEHIVDVFDVGVLEGPHGEALPYLVMELLAGEDLGHRLRRVGRLELDEALTVTSQVLRGLERAHEVGIVHRDLKPDNVFLVARAGAAPIAKILDFGVSKIERRSELSLHTITKEGVVLGTPHYMAPEQAQGLPQVDSRADLWSVGAILYECLTGRPPHGGATYEQVIVRICSVDPPDVRDERPGVSDALADVVHRALAREPSERFPSARAFLEALVDASDAMLLTPPDALPSRVVVDGATPTASLRSRPRIGPRPEAADAPQARSHRATVGTAVALAAVVALSWWGNAPGARATAAGETQPGLGPETAASAAAASAAAASTSATGHAGNVRLELEANAPGARFFVGDRELSSPTLDGPRHARTRLRIEAPGYAPLDAEVLLEGGVAKRLFTLRPLPAAAWSADPAASVSGRPPPRSPRAPASSSQRGEGIAAGLTLRRE
jgi:hypothetical protein